MMHAQGKDICANFCSVIGFIRPTEGQGPSSAQYCMVFRSRQGEGHHLVGHVHRGHAAEENFLSIGATCCLQHSMALAAALFLASRFDWDG